MISMHLILNAHSSMEDNAMKIGKILKFHPGRDANCSSLDYLGAMLVGGLIYTAYSGIVYGILRGKFLTNRLFAGKNWWIGLQVLALVVWLIFAKLSGAADYGTLLICVGPLALVMLIVMAFGASQIGKPPKEKPGS